MKGLISFLSKERENRFLDGLVDNPVMLFYEYFGNEKEAYKRVVRGVDYALDLKYTVGELLAFPVTVPMVLIVSSKKIYQHFKSKSFQNS